MVRNLLAAIVTSITSINSRGNMLGYNLLADGLGEFILNIGTGHLGDSVAMFNLNWDLFDLGVVNTMLSGDLTTSMFNCGGNRVGNSSSNWGNSSMMSIASIGTGKVLRISLGISFSFSFSFSLTFANRVVGSRLVTDGVNDLLADLLVLNLLS